MTSQVVQSSALRSPALDRLRGAAVLVMVLDHVVLLTGGPDLLRLTVGRLAVPAFFVLAGHLAGRLSWRHVRVGLLGLLLGLAVPWVDSPNVLLLWAVGCVVLAGLRRLGVPGWVLIVAAATVAANGWSLAGPRRYDVLALWALMAVGSMVPRSAFAVFGSVPAWVGAVGRHPVAWYVGHVLLLDFVSSTYAAGIWG